MSAPPVAHALYGATVLARPGLAGLPATAVSGWARLQLRLAADAAAAPPAALAWSPVGQAAWLDRDDPACLHLAADPGLSSTNLLCSSLLPAWLASQGALVLRGAALQGARGAALLLGPAMVGKSTLAALLLRRGLRLLSDDVVVLRQIDGAVQVECGAPWLKLWPRPARALFGSAVALARPELNGKCLLPVAPGRPAVVAAAWLLQRAGPSLELSPEHSPEHSRCLSTAAALEVCGMLQRRPLQAPAAAQLTRQFGTLCALLRQLRVQLPCDTRAAGWRSRLADAVCAELGGPPS